jgi:hypothetical protein
VGSIAYGIRVFIIILVASSFSLASSGCVIVRKPPVVAKEAGPPPWACAQGRHARHVYHYYPYQTVYYDTARKIYFYPVDGRWRTGPVLPPDIRLDVRDCRVLEMDTDRPYTFHDDVIRRYVPGQTRSESENECAEDRHNRLPSEAESEQK